MLQHRVLVISDDANFSRAIAARWQAEWRTPILIQTSSDGGEAAALDAYGLVIVGPVRNGAFEPLLRRIDPAPAAICICSNLEEERSLAAKHLIPALFIPPADCWLDILMLLTNEIIKRLDAEARARQAKSSAELLQSECTLGRSMMEMQHVINDALTSLLGNADLLILSEDPLPPQSREQILTIRKMALRLNEVMKRFSSIAAGLDAPEKESQSETGTPVSVRLSRG